MIAPRLCASRQAEVSPPHPYIFYQEEGEIFVTFSLIQYQLWPHDRVGQPCRDDRDVGHHD